MSYSVIDRSNWQMDDRSVGVHSTTPLLQAEILKCIY